jgi:hypothetical protein
MTKVKIALKDPEDRRKKAAERKKAWRKKKLEGMTAEQVKAHWKKESTRTKPYRAKMLLEGGEVKDNYSAKNRDRMRNKREEAKAHNVGADAAAEPQAYPSSRQQFGKDLKKVSSSLPKSPRKRKSLVIGMAEELGIPVSKETKNPMKDQPTAEVIEMAKNFFYREDIVYTMPGRNDTCVVRNPGFGKQTLRKHYLTMFMREAYAVFCAELDAANKIPCSFSHFCKQRPANVFLVGATPKDQCQCLVHENFKLQLLALGVKYDQLIWEKLLCCTRLNSDCWLGECDGCKDGLKLVVKRCGEKQVKYGQWKHNLVPNKKAENKSDLTKGSSKKVPEFIRVLEKNEIKDTVNNIDEFKADFGKVVRHVNIKRIQANAFQADKDDEAIRMLQIDYAMAYQCESQDEVQGKIFSRSSVNLFTAALTTRGTTTTYCIATDYECKDKFSNSVFLRHLYSSVFTKEVEGIEREVIWSDGPSGEFKNRFSVKLIQELSYEQGINFSWKFSARGHGKGVVDGVGGNVKSIVRKRVVSKNPRFQVHIHDAKSFAQVASRYCVRTQVIFISKAKIEEFKQSNPFKGTRAVPGISNMHHIEVNEEKTQLWSNSLFKAAGAPPDVELSPTTIGQCQLSTSANKPSTSGNKPPSCPSVKKDEPINFRSSKMIKKATSKAAAVIQAMQAMKKSCHNQDSAEAEEDAEEDTDTEDGVEEHPDVSAESGEEEIPDDSAESEEDMDEERPDVSAESEKEERADDGQWRKNTQAESEKDTHADGKPETLAMMMKKCIQSLDDTSVDGYVAIFYSDRHHWGKLKKLFHHDKDNSELEKVEVSFLKPRADDFYEWGKGIFQIQILCFLLKTGWARWTYEFRSVHVYPHFARKQHT